MTHNAFRARRARSVSTAALLGVFVLATACTAQSTPAASDSAVAHATTPASASSPGSGSSAPASAGVQNLVVSASVRRELTSAYEAFMHFQASGIAGTLPNSVYYAYDPATGAYWAMATFRPSAAALKSKPGSPLFNELTDMQDGGDQGIFTRTSGGAWQVQDAGVPPQCQIVKFFPKAVIAAWALRLYPCPAAG
jgi:hypothetical protein